MKPRHPFRWLFLGAALLSLARGQGNEALRDLAQARGFQVGAAVTLEALFDPTEPEYAATLAREFNILTPENALKWPAIRPARGQYTYTAADALVGFARQRGIAVRGHTLVWHQQLPNWLQTGNLPPAELAAILQNHIRNVVTHYKDSIQVWDVVNEAVSDRVENGKAPMRDTPWSKIGPDYIAQAFRWARAANKTAKLFYNDYGAETMNAKAQTVFELVRDLKARGVPIDGVGLQMHVGIKNPPDIGELRANLRRLNDLSLEVQITEMDVKLDDARPREAQLEAQARVYADVLQACLEANCTAFVLWGFTDAHSWLTSSKPLIFASDYSPKPAYAALLDVLRGR